MRRALAGRDPCGPCAARQALRGRRADRLPRPRPEERLKWALITEHFLEPIRPWTLTGRFVQPSTRVDPSDRLKVRARETHNTEMPALRLEQELDAELDLLGNCAPVCAGLWRGAQSARDLQPRH